MEKELIEGAVRIIQTVGFPIVVCIWFMFRMEKKLEAQTEVMREIATSMSDLLKVHKEEGI